MLCTRGETWTPPKKSGIYFMCRYSECDYYNRQCKWVRWCHASKSYVPRTDDSGYVCEHYTVEPQVVQEEIVPLVEEVKETVQVLEEPIVEKSKIVQQPPKIKIFEDVATEVLSPEPEVEQVSQEAEQTSSHTEEVNMISKILKSSYPEDENSKGSYLSRYNK